MAGRDGGEEEDRALRARLEKLSGALEAKRKVSRAERDVSAAEEESSKKSGSAMALGLRVASEFVAAIVVGGFIGWQLDAWLGTKPAFLIAFFFLGVAAGVWNVIRATTPPRNEAPAPSDKKIPPLADEDED